MVHRRSRAGQQGSGPQPSQVFKSTVEIKQRWQSRENKEKVLHCIKSWLHCGCNYNRESKSKRASALVDNSGMGLVFIRSLQG